MTTADISIREQCQILPFRKPSTSEGEVTTTTIAALVAVTIIHETGVSAEDHLLDIIERSGEAEILDSEDAFAELGLLEQDDQLQISHDPANDNTGLKLVPPTR